MILKFILMLMMLFPIWLHAQTTDIEWQYRYGGGGVYNDSYLESLKRSNRNFVIGGDSQSDSGGVKTENHMGYSSMWLIKTDSLGHKIWDKTIGGGGADYLNDIAVLYNNSYLIGASSSSGKGGDKSQPSFCTNCEDFPTYDIWIVKVDSLGNKIWDRSFGTAKDELFMKFQVIENGDVLAVGRTDADSGAFIEEGNFGGVDCFLMKINELGEKLWTKRFGGNKYDFFTSICKASDNTFLIGGGSLSDKSGNKSQSCYGEEDFWILNIDSSGNILWDKTFGGSSSDILYTVKKTKGGGFILGGDTYSQAGNNLTQPSRGSSDFWIVKIDSSGNLQWEKRFGGNYLDEMYSLEELSDGSFLLIGNSQSGVSGDKTENNHGEPVGPNQYRSDIWIIKIDSIGNILWDRTIGGSDYDNATSSVLLSDGSVVIGAYTSSIDGDAIGVSYGSPDYWLIKIKETDLVTGNISPNSELPHIYPNPSQNGLFTLSSTTFSGWQYSISDMLGNNVLTGIAEEETRFDLSNLPTAIYHLRLSSGAENKNFKLVKR